MITRLTYTPTGTCCKQISISLDTDGYIEKVWFIGGCPGNTTAVAKLIQGKHAKDVIVLLKGTKCGSRSTSCVDQLCLALEEMLK